MALRAGFHGTLGQPTSKFINGSLRFNSTTGHQLSRTPSSDSNLKTATWSFWVKRQTTTSGNDTIFGFGPDAANDGQIYFNSNGYIYIFFRKSSSTQITYQTSRIFKDVSSWYHIVVSVDTTQASGQVKLYVNGAENTQWTTSTDATQNADLIINDASFTNYIGRPRGNASQDCDILLTNVHCIDGQALDASYFGFTDRLTNTWRPKKAIITGVNDGTVWSSYGTVSGGSIGSVSELFDGDIASTVVSGTSSGSTITYTFTEGIPYTESVKIYCTAGGSSRTVKINSESAVGAVANSYVTVATGSGTMNSFSIYTGTETDAAIGAIQVDGVIMRDGDKSNFGINGFYLPMDQESSFNLDKSGNGNNFTATNFSGTTTNPDVFKDSPSGITYTGEPTTGITSTSALPSNYPTMNPLDTWINKATLTNNNLTVTGTSSQYSYCRATMAADSGKFYFEATYDGGNGLSVGVCERAAPTQLSISDRTIAAAYRNLAYFYNSVFYVYIDGSLAYTGGAYSSGDVCNVAVDLDKGKVWFGQNGVWQGSGTQDPANNVGGYSPTNLSSATAFFQDGQGSGVPTGTFNFGQTPFKYTPPGGFPPLTSSNSVPVNIIASPDQYVGVTTYTGNGGTQSLNVGFKPDFVWIKRRDVTTSHLLYDTVRGTGPTAELISNATYSEGSVADTNAAAFGYLSSFNNNGFTVVAGSTNGVYTNESGSTYVAWTWKAGGGTGITTSFWKDDVGYATAAAAGLTAGDASEVTGSSVGTKQGFSIISYTSAASDTGSAQIPHGLSQTPDFVIIKNRDWAASSQGWPVWHSAVPNQSRYLDSTNAWDATEFSYFFNNTAPTSTVVNVSSNASVSSANRYRSYGGSDKFIMYCWHNVPGLQKFGTYRGSANTIGTYVELGFTPKIILWKRSSSTSDWVVWSSDGTSADGTGLNPYNFSGKYQDWNTADAEGNISSVEMYSNGFKFYSANFPNDNNDYIYAAWAEAPMSNLNGAQVNAR